MLKVLIVDDEPIFRMGIRSCVSWEEIGCTVCGEASNGKEALFLIEEQHPDIVFLDIKMPVMDGIEVMRDLVQTDEAGRPCVVILSCYNEYEYVREAMKLGAYDYLFKPVMGVEEITRVLQEIRDYCADKKNNGKNRKVTAEKIAEILEECADQGVSSENRQKLQNMDSNLIQNSFVAVGLCFGKNKEHICPDDGMMDICKSAFAAAFGERECYCFCRKETDILYFIIKASERVSFSLQQLKAELITIAGQVEKTAGCEIRIGSSRLGGYIDTYTEYIEQASGAVSASWFTGEKVTLAFGAKEDGDHGKQIYEVYTEKLQELLGKRDIEQIREILEQIKAEVIGEGYYSEEDYCRFLASNAVGFMRRFQGGEVLEQLLLEDIGLISSLYHQFHIDAVNERFCSIMEICYRSVDHTASGKNKEIIVRQAMGYIRENYSQKLTLDELADRYHLNKNYFCKIFKEVSGHNLVSFITGVRMEKATDLLKNSDKKIGTIAEEVGYFNYSHFCKTYRKYCHVSPAEVRRNQIAD